MEDKRQPVEIEHNPIEDLREKGQQISDHSSPPEPSPTTPPAPPQVDQQD